MLFLHAVLQEKSGGRNAHYKLTTTVMLWLQTNKQSSGTMNLGGSLTRQIEADQVVTDSSSHIVNIGRMVEVSRTGNRLKAVVYSDQSVTPIFVCLTGHGKQNSQHAK